MKNNTKLIMETWRRFLKEGPEGIGTDGMVLDADEVVNDSSLSPVEDSDLEGDVAMIDRMHDDEHSPDSDMYYGDPAHMGSQSSAPMLPMADGDDDGEFYAGEDSVGPYYTDGEYDETGNDSDENVTFDGSEDDSMHDMDY